MYVGLPFSISVGGHQQSNQVLFINTVPVLLQVSLNTICLAERAINFVTLYRQLLTSIIRRDIKHVIHLHIILNKLYS